MPWGRLQASDFAKVDIGKWLSSANKTRRGEYGLLPKLALLFLSSCTSSSFCERINSAAKQIMPPNRTNLKDDILETRVLLRMNKRFIQHFEARYAAEWEEHMRSKSGLADFFKQIVKAATSHVSLDRACFANSMRDPGQ